MIYKVLVESDFDVSGPLRHPLMGQYGHERRRVQARWNRLSAWFSAWSVKQANGDPQLVACIVPELLKFT
jgi:hypothetical protein